MSVTLNAKGTSVSNFTVGKDGTTLTQSGSITPPGGNNLTVVLATDKFLNIDGGLSGPSLITTTDTKDLHINPAIGGGQYLLLNAVRWPTTDGTTGQVLATNGSGVLSFVSKLTAPNYEEYVATGSQTVFNTTLATTAKASGKSYLQIFVNGTFQQEGGTKQYTVTGANQITFNAGLTVSDNVVIYGYV
jgi:hypothetical protein